MTGPVQPTVHLVTDGTWEKVACGLPGEGMDEGADRATASRAQVTCQGCLDADAAGEPLLTGLAALRLARRVGIAHTRSLRARDDYEAVKLTASMAFAQMRRRGIPNQEIRLPGGEKVAVISIEQGGTTMTVDPDLLTLIAAGNNPADFEDYAEVRAFTDRRVIALIAEHFPELVGRRLSDRALADYKREAEENGGGIVNRLTGEREQVAEITRHEPTGKFAVRFTPKGRQLLQDALDSGAISESGESADDVAIVPAGGEPSPMVQAAADLIAARAGTAHPVASGPADGTMCFNEDGAFKSPEMAAFHAIHVQGGFSTPAREARRMVKDGGPSGEMARAWLAERSLSVDGDGEPS